tara:strand:+ start:352 stop:555 length:204 start_codon:yes stop_codon:yes gene_type:complete
MDNDKIEIKARPKGYYYIDLLKEKLNKIIRPIIIVLIAVCTLYIGFYVLLLMILLLAISYLINLFRK